MSVNDDIEKARAIYRRKKLPAVEQQKQIAASQQATKKSGESIKEYFVIFFTIMKRDIIFKLGLQSDEDENNEVKKETYTDFMEAHFGLR